MDKQNRFFFLKILDLMTKRIKSKVIIFEVLLILFVAVSIGLILVLYIERTLTVKAHVYSERIVKDLVKSLENNYNSLPASDEAVKSFKDSQGILYLGYQGFIMSAKKMVKEQLFIGDPISESDFKTIDPALKNSFGFKMSDQTSRFNSSMGEVLFRYGNKVIFSIESSINNLLNKKKSNYQPMVNRNEIQFFEYYMPVFVKAGLQNKKIGNVIMRYSLSIIQKEIKTARDLIIIITGLIILIGIYISIRGSNYIVKPIVHLTNVVKKFGAGDMTVRAMLPAKDEIGILANTFDDMIVSIREKLEMQKFVSDSTVKMIKKSVNENQSTFGKDKHTERKEVTLFFSDIRGFTSMSEKLDPQEVVDILNEYLDVQSGIIKNFKGDIDKYVGDEIVAVFESENMHMEAVEAAQEAQRKILELNRKRKEKELPPVDIGIGINSGEVVMGSIGSHDRMDFTVIGDNVNLASRLCSAAGKGEIIISKSVCDKVKHVLKRKVVKLEPISVKGKANPIEVYRVDY